MDPESLVVFLAAARTQSILGAAQACNTSRGRVRRQLDELEERVQTPLFVRERSGLSLTAAGELLRERMTPLVDEAQHVLDNVRRVGEDPTGTLTIAANTLTPSIAVKEFFALCWELFPDVSVDGTACTDVLAMLREGHEVGLLLAEEVPDGPWTAFRGVTLQAGLFASPAYVERHGAPATPEELAEHRITSWKYPGNDGRSLALRDGGTIAIDPFLVSSYGEPIWLLVEGGQAIGNFSAAAFGGDELVPILADHVRYEVHVWVVLARAALAIPRVRALHRLMQTAADATQSAQT